MKPVYTYALDTPLRMRSFFASTRYLVRPQLLSHL